MTTSTSERIGPPRFRSEPDSTLIAAVREIAPIVRAESHEAERERRLSAPVLNALRETGLLRMTTPRSFGGLETDPVTRALVVEEMGRHDSAAGRRSGQTCRSLACRTPARGRTKPAGSEVER
jgi:alkylation response protein AidB-like acyl-CoA dehydrogenase